MLLALILLVGTPAPDGGHRVLLSTGVSAADWKLLPECSGDGGDALNYSTATRSFACGAISVPAATTPGGSSPQVQYNNSGAFGGMANYQSDGTRPSVVPEKAHPTAPATNSLYYGYQLDGGWPAIPFTRDPMLGTPAAIGSIAAWFKRYGTDSNWFSECEYPNTWGTTTWITPMQASGTSPAVSGGTGAGAAAAVVYDAGTWFGRQRWAGAQTGTGNEVWMSIKQATYAPITRLGGFLFFIRTTLTLNSIHPKLFIGVATTTVIGGTNGIPSAATNTLYYGSDGCSDVNLNICSNDGSGSATCSSLGSSFPRSGGNTCVDNGSAGADATPYIYDMWFWAPPGAAYVNYRIDNLTNGATTSGQLTSDLPAANALLQFQMWGDNGWDAGAKASSFFLGETCWAVSW